MSLLECGVNSHAPHPDVVCEPDELRALILVRIRGNVYAGGFLNIGGNA